MAALDAIEPLDARVAASSSVRPDDYYPGIWETNVLDGALYGVPWYVDTRLVFYRSDLLATAGVSEFPRSWSAWRAAMEAVKRTGGPGRYGLLLPTNEWAQPVTLAVAAGAELLSDGGRHGAFRAPEFRRAAEFFIGLYRDGLAPPLANSQVANLYQQMAAGEFAMYVTGPVEPRGVPAPPPGEPAGLVGDGAAPRARRVAVARRLPRRRIEPRRLPLLSAKGRGVEGRRVPLRAGHAEALLGPLRRPAGPPLGVGRAGSRRRRAGPPRSASSSSTSARRRRSPSGSRSRRRCGSGSSRSPGAPGASTSRWRASTPTSRRSSRSGAGCSTGRPRGPGSEGLSSWRAREARSGLLLVAPGLLLLSVVPRPPRRRVAPPEPDRLRPLRRRRPVERARRRPPQLRPAPARPGLLEGAREHVLLRRRRRAAHRLSRPRHRAPPEPQARPLPGPLPDDLLRPRRHDARRRRGGLEVPLPPALRTPERGSRPRRHRRRSTGSATPTGRCRRSS